MQSGFPSGSLYFRFTIFIVASTLEWWTPSKTDTVTSFISGIFESISFIAYNDSRLLAYFRFNSLLLPIEQSYFKADIQVHSFCAYRVFGLKVNVEVVKRIPLNDTRCYQWSVCWRILIHCRHHRRCFVSRFDPEH